MILLTLLIIAIIAFFFILITSFFTATALCIIGDIHKANKAKIKQIK